VRDEFSHFVELVEAGESIRITRDGRTVALLIPDAGFMTGRAAAELFRGYVPDSLDRAAADVWQNRLRIWTAKASLRWIIDSGLHN
jgi:antitoxin (DNA-binding transcriptional repressor) of toxin-antitoxin stability system